MVASLSLLDPRDKNKSIKKIEELFSRPAYDEEYCGGDLGLGPSRRFPT